MSPVTFLEDADELVADLATYAQAHDLPAPRIYTDPAQAANNRPCVYLAPPTTDRLNRRRTWRLIALSGEPTGTLAAIAQLAELCEQVAALAPLDGPETPTTYDLGTGDGPIPAYVLPLTTTLR